MAINPLKNITEQFLGGVDSVLGAFGAGGNRVAKYPLSEFKSVTNAIDPLSSDWKDSLGYEFQVMNDSGGSPTSTAAGWAALKLQINPQELNQDEIFAIKVTPTFKGILVEHQGITFQNITLSGTTGISPNRGAAGALSTGAPSFGKGHSGYAEFHELRNYFRAYAEAKRRPGGDKLRLVFRNFKDREFLIVEPQRFSMKRSATKSTLYNYTIQMKAIGRADAPQKAKFFGDTLFETINKVSTAFQDASSILTGFVGFIQQSKQDVVDSVITPLNEIIDALEVMKVTGQTIIDVTRSTIDDLKKEIEALEDNLNDFLGKDNEGWNETKGRTPTVVGTKGRTSSYNELLILNAVQKIKRGAASLLQSSDIFVEDVAASASNVENLFAGKISLPVPNTVKEITIDGNDTIQSIAARELGDPDRFREIVQINNLKPPFIVQEIEGQPAPVEADRVLIPGQKILLPQDDGRSEQTVAGVIRNKDYNITKELKESEKNFGVDIALTEDNDIAISNTGDMDLKAGFENLAQAIYLKLFLKKGSLKRHPEIGANLGVGEKATNASQLKREVEESINFDPRIDNIPFSSFTQDGNVTEMKLLLKVKDVDQPLPLPLRL